MAAAAAVPSKAPLFALLHAGATVDSSSKGESSRVSCRCCCKLRTANCCCLTNQSGGGESSGLCIKKERKSWENAVKAAAISFTCSGSKGRLEVPMQQKKRQKLGLLRRKLNCRLFRHLTNSGKHGSTLQIPGNDNASLALLS